MRKFVPEQFRRDVFTAKKIALVIMLMQFSMVALSQSQLVKDINKDEAASGNEYSEFTVCNGKTFFISLGTELWLTTGTNTYRLKSFKSIRDLTAVGTVLYFAADDGISGEELWRSSGSASGTVKVRDIRAGSNGSSPKELIAVNNLLYFVANDGSHGNEIWKSSGTSSGTLLVKDIFPGSPSSSPSRLTNVNGTVFFSANDNVKGYELWKTNGTSSGTVLVKDIYASGKTGSFPELLTNVNGTLFFVALDPTTGRELWKSDGTTGGTLRVKDIYPGSTSSSIDQVTNVNGTAFFMANNGVAGLELWKSNGTSAGTVIVKDLNPGAEGNSEPANFTNVNGVLFFTARKPVGSYSEVFIWRSDGTANGTVMIQDVRGLGPEAKSQPSFIYLNGYVYYISIVDDLDEYEFDNYLMRAELSGANPTRIQFLGHVMEPSQILYTEIVKLNSWLIFSGRVSSDEDSGYKLIRSDGTTVGTVVIKDAWAPNHGSDPRNMIPIGNAVYFKADKGDFVAEGLWRTNGTSGGTMELKTGWAINEMYKVGNTLFFGLQYAQEKYQLWKVVGDTGTPTLVKELPERVMEFPQFNRDINGIFYFMVDYVLWRSDGTDAGTYPLKSFFYVRDMQVLGNNLIIRIYNSDYQEEMWKSDGTVGGTTLLKTIRSTYGYRSSPNDTGEILNGVMYFGADDGTTGFELWRTNGTTSGTYRVIDLRSGDANIVDVHAMEVLNNKLYFSAVDNTGHWNLFSTNGTASGTVKIKDMGDREIQEMILKPDNSGLYLFTRTPEGVNELSFTNGSTVTFLSDLDTQYFYTPADYQFINDRLFFITNENLYAAEQKDNLWISDGTACGTLRVNVGPKNLISIEQLGSKLIFGGSTDLLGRELWSWDIGLAPASPCATSAAGFDAIVVEEKEPVRYGPNPFTNDFVLNAKGDEGETFDVVVHTSTGMQLESHETLPVNTDNRLGQQWTPGVYILRLHKRGQIETIKVAKK
jgi:ELWxxDGT repeat protein